MFYKSVKTAQTHPHCTPCYRQTC